MKRLISSTMIALLICTLSGSAAESNHDVLPWGMTWEFSLPEYVHLLQKHVPQTEYTIKEYPGGGEYSVDQRIENVEQSISYRGVFVGEVTSKTIMEHQLRDVENKALDFEWMGIDFAPVGVRKDLQELYQGNAISAFERLYDEFVLAYGPGNAEYSYIKIQAAEGDRAVSHALPQENGEINFDAIKRHFVNHVEKMDTYWLVIGSGHASCRFYVTTTRNPDGTQGKIWRSSYYFTREEQEAIRRDAVALP